MESENLIPFETKGYGQDNRSRKVYKPPLISSETRDLKGIPVSSVKTSPEERILPIPFDSALSRMALLAYKMFNIDNPCFSPDYKVAQGEILRGVVDFYDTFNNNPKRKLFTQEVAYRSISEEGFNDTYSKLYKYCRQCYLGIHWSMPDEFPFPEGIQGISSWKAFRSFIMRTGGAATPEIIIPPELLYPWASPKPEDIEYLEQEPAVNTLDEKKMYDIIISKLKPPSMIPTTTDFILSQTNTKMAVNCASVSQVIKHAKQGKRLTDYKYMVVTKWSDDGFPEQEPLAVRTPVWKRTTEYRDAITLNPSTLFKVWKLNSTLKYMIADPGVGDYKDMLDMKIFSKSYSFFIMTDWKKSGLTIPHWFVKLTIQAITEISGIEINFPVNGWPIFDQSKNKWFKPTNFGYGLGMVNNVYTLFNLCLFEYAKQQGIFEEGDKMFSFNDDSIIGASSERSYNSWLGLCRKSGGYLDEHKTFTATGVQFCEMHQFKDLRNNFKFVSAFKTLLTTLIDCFNWDQWRFHVSDCWDQIRGFDSDISNEVPWQHFIGTMEHYINMLGSKYWGVEELPLGPPELGGAAIGYSYRTDYSLKNTLILLEEKKGWDLIKAQNYLRASKEAFSHTPEFRPWKRLPLGPTRNYMLELGKYAGLHHELESFSLKAHNKFVTNTMWYKVQFWTHYTKMVKEATAKPVLDHDFWIWCKQERWPSYAIPTAFVLKEEKLPPMQRVLPFVRIQKEGSRYSLPSMMEAFIKHMTNQLVLTVPVEDISFKGYLLWEAPIVGDTDHYCPIVNMELISKIADFSDPRRVFLDYWYRHNAVITELDLPDFRSDAAIELISKIEGRDIRTLGFDKATWYTKVPLPYKSSWSETLTSNLPDTHEQLILSILEDGSLLSEETAIFLKEDFDNDRRQNSSYWKQKTKSKVKGHQKRKAALEGKAPAQTTTEEEILTLLNMDDIQEVMDRIRFGQPKLNLVINKEPVELPPILSYSLSQMEEPDWLSQDCGLPQDEEEYNWDQEEDENSYLDRALDQLNSRFNEDDGIG
jgi:hypothetical protein